MINSLPYEDRNSRAHSTLIHEIGMASLDPAQGQPDKAGRLSRRKGGRATSPVSVVNDKSSELSHDSMPTVIGRYEITAFLGAGQMGCVYRGRDTVLGRDVAIKVPKLEGSGPQAVLIRRFYREARAVARLTHRSICPIYDVGEVDGKTFIAMGFVNGKTLDHFVGRGNFLKPRSSLFR